MTAATAGGVDVAARPVPTPWARGHAALALAVTAAALMGAAVAPAPGLGVQVMLVAGLVAVLGIPHGAVDHIEGRALLRPLVGRAWGAVFGGGYTLAALLVVAAWIAWPPLLLTGFLLLAIGHFGTEDTASLPLWGRPRSVPGAVESALRGGLPVLLPILFQPEATGRLFAALLPATPEAAVVGALQALGPLVWPYLAALGTLGLSALIRRHWVLAGELAALTATFWLLPPLLAFAVYFCLWHSPRHTLTVIARQGPSTLAAGMTGFVRAAWPLTAVTLAAAAAAWALRAAAAGGAVATLQVVFIGLAALTVPHVGLAAWRQVACNST